MSATAPAAPDLIGMVVQSAASDRAVDGFDHRHEAEAEQVVPIAVAFRACGYTLEMLTCEDRRADLEAMRLVYTYNRLGEVDRHVVFVSLPPEIPGAQAPSITGAFAGADWFEREIFDMYGVRFSGHPDLKRILLPDDADFHALLKDFGRIEDAAGAEGEDAS